MSEIMDSTPLPEPNNTPQFDPNEHLNHLLAPELETPWFRSLIESVRELVHPAPLPPIQVTSKPVAVKDIWGLYGKKKESSAYSLAIHVTVVVLLFTLASSKAVQQAAKNLTTTLIAPDLAPTIASLAGMGGGS